MAAFAMCWVVIRACVQAVTIDEAVTFNNFVEPAIATHWQPHANNHILNSLIMRFFTAIFGAVPLTIRSGAMVGALVYILAVYYLCRFVTAKAEPGFWLRVSLFACLVYNPLIMDYLVAARGYGLAIAFLASGLAAVAWFDSHREGAAFRALVRACVLASVCLALSVVANFSFALMDAAIMLAVYFWAARRSGAPQFAWKGWAKYFQLAAACALPGLAVALVLAGSALLHFPRGELVYGAWTFNETVRSLADASIYEPNPFFLNPLIVGVFQRNAHWLLPAAGVICVLRLTILILQRRSARRDANTDSLVSLGALLCGAGLLAVGLHWIAFHKFQVFWPKDRTGIFLVVLITLFAGILAAIPVPTRLGWFSQRLVTIALFVLGSYFMLCLRVGYFKEWRFDADIDKVYSVLAYYNHTCRLREVAVSWRYDSTLNFYRALSGRENFPDFTGTVGEYPAGKRAYVLFSIEEEKVIRDRHLAAVYRGATGATVAIDPAVSPPEGAVMCDVTLPLTGIRW